jgi:hypothetical protein
MSGKRQSGAVSSQHMRKRSKIDLEMKMKMINKYESGQSLSTIARELGLSVSTVNTIVKDADRIKEHVRGSAPMKSTIITKQRSHAIYEMEKLLTAWIEDQIQKRVPLSMMLIKAKARSVYGDIKEKYPDSPESFVASTGWFNRFKNRAGLLNAKVSAEAASGDAEAAEELMPLEEAKVSSETQAEASEEAKVSAETQAEASEEAKDEPKRFTAKEMSLAFRHIAAGMAKFEKMDSNASRFLKVQRAMEDAIACYREIYEGKKAATIQLSFDRFIEKRGPTAADLTTSHPSTSYVVSAVDPDV